MFIYLCVCVQNALLGIHVHGGTHIYAHVYMQQHSLYVQIHIHSDMHVITWYIETNTAPFSPVDQIWSLRGRGLQGKERSSSLPSPTAVGGGGEVVAGEGGCRGLINSHHVEFDKDILLFWFHFLSSHYSLHHVLMTFLGSADDYSLQTKI